VANTEDILDVLDATTHGIRRIRYPNVPKWLYRNPLPLLSTFAEVAQLG
jgi:hypothetical protein